MNCGDGVEHDPVNSAGQEAGQGSDAAGGDNVLAGDALVLQTTMITWRCSILNSESANKILIGLLW